MGQGIKIGGGETHHEKQKAKTFESKKTVNHTSGILDFPTDNLFSL